MRARKGWAAVFAALVMTAVQAANLSVTDVKIAQRYPWNGLVDITYTVNCDDPNKDVWVYPVGYDADTATTAALKTDYLSGAGASNAVHNGTHQMTWNMAKQMGKGYNRAAFSVKLHAYCDAAPYMVIDLSAGSEAEKYPITYLSEVPEDGWTTEPYKTTKMVFRLIPPGNQGGVTITKPFYCALFPITCRQYSLILGGNSSSSDWYRGLSYDMIRGCVLGSQWPRFQQVDGDSLLAKLRLRTGFTIDLPTLGQWCQATYPSTGSPWAWEMKGVGEIGEWCLDWGEGYAQKGSSNADYLLKYPREIRPAGIDSVGPESNINNARVVCGRYFSKADQPSASHYGYEGFSYVDKNNSTITDIGLFTADITSARYNRNNVEGLGARLVALPVCK